MCVLANLEYLSILFCAVFLAAVTGLVAVLPMWDSAYVSGTVTSQAIFFSLAHVKQQISKKRYYLAAHRRVVTRYYNFHIIESIATIPTK